MLVVISRWEDQTILIVSRRFKLSSSPSNPANTTSLYQQLRHPIMLTLTLTADLTGLVMCVRRLTLS
jgi:hypothetical protein